MTTLGVAVVVEDSRDRVLLLLRGPTAPWMPNRWNLPGGHVEPGEAAHAAARREVFEEARLRVFALALLARVGDLAVFRAVDWAGRVRLLDGEHTRAAWVPKASAWTWNIVPIQRGVLHRYAST